MPQRSAHIIGYMIDLKALRENPQPARDSQTARGNDPELVDRILDADAVYRAALTEFENLRAEQKAFSKQIGKATPEERITLKNRASEMSAQVKALQATADERQSELRDLLYQMQNIIIPGIPSGGEEDYVVRGHFGPEPRDFAAEGITVRDHLDVGEKIGAIDTARGTKVSGARFYYLRGAGARLELALLTMAWDYAEENGFTPMTTPTMVTTQTMSGTGFLGAHSDEIYYLPADDLYLTGTSEVALAGYHANEIIDVSKPIKYSGWSACYRREAGSYGKDTRGIIRVHQFNKVEMFIYCLPEMAEDMHEALLGYEQEMLARMEIPYRVIDTAAGDLGSSAARKFDCEAWLPSQERYLELTSTSNCTTFQARRLNIRSRGVDGKTQPVATLNGTLATTRWLVALLENHQQADGSVYVPEALRPYLGGREALPAVRDVCISG